MSTKEPKKISIDIKQQERWCIKAIKSCEEIHPEVQGLVDQEGVVVFDVLVGGPLILAYPCGGILKTSHVHDLEELTETTAMVKTKNSLYLLERIAVQGSEVNAG